MTIRRQFTASVLVWVCAFHLAGCSSLSVVRIGSGQPNSTDDTAVGQRYYLPKPFLLATPQPNGTVSFSVIYLPDENRKFAVSASAKLSSYSLQVITDPSGILAGIQYNVDNTAIPAQVLASGATTAAQIANYKASEAVAVQTQVNAAQTQLTKDQSALASDTATAQSLQQAFSGESGATGATTQANVDSANAKVAADKSAIGADTAALAQANAAAQAIAGTAQFGSPLSTTAAGVPTAPTSLPASSLPVATTLPDAYGPLLFAIHQTPTDVKLVPVTNDIPDTTQGPAGTFPSDAEPRAQRRFQTSQIAVPAPQIAPPTVSFDRGLNAPAQLALSRVPKGVTLKVFSTADLDNPVAAAKPTWDNLRSIFIDTPKLDPGGYVLDAKIAYTVDDTNTGISHQRIYFVVTDSKAARAAASK